MLLIKKYSLLLLLAGAVQGGLTQDYIVTWTNDTIACAFPDKPGKSGIRPARKYENGHIRVPAVFANDSLRVIEAGEIKGYFRKNHGRYLLCNGLFEAKKLESTEQLGLDRSERKEPDRWYFMNRQLEGKFASLYLIYIPGRYAPQPVYLVTKYNDPDPLKAYTIWNKKSARKLLADADIKTGMENFLSGKKVKKFSDMIKEYNRLKETISSGVQ